MYIVIVFLTINIFYLYNIYLFINKLINFNNIILEEKAEIIKINNISQSLLLSNINNNYYITDCNIYSNINIILITTNIIIIITLNMWFHLLQIILILILSISSFIIIPYYLYSINNKIYLNIKMNNEKEIEIINKKDEINNIYSKKLFIIIDNNNDINYIDNSIDEYITNYKYLHNNNKINKNELINNKLKKELIKNKNNELMIIMKSNLSSFDTIIEEIVKYELDELNIKLNDYIRDLNIKINKLQEINSIIIDINH